MFFNLLIKECPRAVLGFGRTFMVINPCTNFVVNLNLLFGPSLRTWDIKLFTFNLALNRRQCFSLLRQFFVFQIIELLYAIWNMNVKTSQTVRPPTNIAYKSFWLGHFSHCIVLILFGLFFLLYFFVLLENLHFVLIQRRRSFYLFQSILFAELDMFSKRFFKKSSFANITSLKRLFVEDFINNFIVMLYLLSRPFWSRFDIVLFGSELLRNLWKLFLVLFVFLCLLNLELLYTGFPVDLQWCRTELSATNVTH